MLQGGDPCGLASPFAKATEDKSEAALQGGDPSASHPPSPRLRGTRARQRSTGGTDLLVPVMISQ